MHRLELGNSGQARVRPGSGATDATPAPGKRLLVPVKRVGDVVAVLSYLATLDNHPVNLAIVHVTAPTTAISAPALPGDAERLLDQVEAYCRADAVAHESFIVDGDPAFSILDAAELLACDAIVLPVVTTRPWHYFLLNNMARRILRLQRDVPVVFINADGIVIPRNGA